MDKRTRTNLFLVVGVIALALVIWLAPEPSDDTPGIAMFPAGTVFSRIEVREHGDARLVLERRDDDWRLTFPREVRADEFQVDSLLTTLQQPATRRYPGAEADLEQLGLAVPQWTVVINDAELAIGGRTAVGNHRYVRSGEHIYLVNDTISYRLQREPLDYASKKLLPMSRGLGGIELPAGQKLQKTESGWQLVPENDAASADDIQKLVSAWQAATAMRVKAVEDVPDGERVVIEFDQGSPVEFVADIDDSSFGLIRVDSKLRYELARDDARRLLQLEVATQTTDSEVTQ